MSMAPLNREQHSLGIGESTSIEDDNTITKKQEPEKLIDDVYDENAVKTNYEL